MIYRLLSLLLVLFSPLIASAAELTLSDGRSEAFMRGTVVSIVEEGIRSDAGDQFVQKIRVQFTDGIEKGKEVEIDYGLTSTILEKNKLLVGDKIIAVRMVTPESIEYTIEDRNRLGGLSIMAAIFVGLILLFTGRRGIGALFGLGLTALLLLFVIIPQIQAGKNPLLVSLLGAVMITIGSLYLAHGYRRRTTIAVVSSLITLSLAAVAAVAVSSLLRLSGSGSEGAFFLQTGALANVNLEHILLSAIILGVVGVLDDITSAQVALVEELKIAKPTSTYQALYQAGLSVGREHITSLVNTLFLAYVGASFTLLLMFTISNTQPVWVLINSEFIAEELVRTFIGSVALILAVPIATSIAAHMFSKKEPK